MERTVVPHSSFIFSISAWMRFSEVLSSAEVDLVQYQDAGVFEKDAGQRDTLALTAGEVGAALGQHKLIAALQLLNVGGDAGLARCLPDLLKGNLALHAVADVVVDRIRSEKGRLGHERHVFSQNGARERIGRNAARQLHHGAVHVRLGIHQLHADALLRACRSGEAR